MTERKSTARMLHDCAAIVDGQRAVFARVVEHMEKGMTRGEGFDDDPDITSPYDILSAYREAKYGLDMSGHNADFVHELRKQELRGKTYLVETTRFPGEGVEHWSAVVSVVEDGAEIWRENVVYVLSRRDAVRLNRKDGSVMAGKFREGDKSSRFFDRELAIEVARNRLLQLFAIDKGMIEVGESRA